MKKNKICSCCGKSFYKEKHGRICNDCNNKKQREYREKSKNKCTKKYEKTFSGYVMRMYRNMKSRITGIQKKKYHLYIGKELLSKEDFYFLCNYSEKLLDLFNKYIESNYDQKLAPSVDRINPDLGYTIDNIQFITHSENSRRAIKYEK